MNFLIDANLPRCLVRIFQERGHSAIHTLELPNGNATLDAALLNYSDENNQLIDALSENRFVELTREHIIIHA